MWREKLREVEALARAFDAQPISNCHEEESGDAAALVTGATQALVAYLDDGDEPLVAYAAVRHLEQRVVAMQQQQQKLHEAERVTQYELLVELLLPTKTGDKPAHRWTASSGYRFQLLRSVVQPKTSSDGSSDSNSEDDEDGEYEFTSSSPLSTRPGLSAVLNHTKQLQSIAISCLQEGKENPVQPMQSTFVYELLGFLAELTKQLTVAAEQEEATAMELKGFYELIRTLMDIFSSTYEFTKQPTYVSNTIVGFLHQFLRFLNASTSAGTSKSEWLRRYLRLLMAKRSPITLFALELLEQQQHASESSEISSQASFICSESKFPFLQSWISFASAVALAIAQANAKNRPGWANEDTISGLHHHHHQSLPDRVTVLAVLSEQDDVMVEVLHTLLQLTLVVESQDGCRSTADPTYAWLVEYLREQLDPDLLFADILSTFGHDHLVLLDLLISSETVMLEYLLRYLRRLASNWESSRAVFSRRMGPQTVDAVLAVLIRLRLEIDKQVAVGMFPYNATPLRRRLVHVEELYEMA